MTKQQYGVLPYFPKTRKKDVVLITSRTHGNWTLAKGNLMKDRSRRDTALREAYEEAGVVGELDKRPPMRVMILREGRKIQLTVYLMRVKKMRKKYPEASQRDRRIASFKKAESLVACEGMKKAMRRWRKLL